MEVEEQEETVVLEGEESSCLFFSSSFLASRWGKGIRGEKEEEG